LIGLVREKPYDSIAVTEILHGANVGRSTFYAHFQDQNELLDSGIHEMLRTARGRPASGTAFEQIVAFSLPILEYIDEHRGVDGPPMTRESRAAMHLRLKEVLTDHHHW